MVPHPLTMQVIVFDRQRELLAYAAPRCANRVESRAGFPLRLSQRLNTALGKIFRGFSPQPRTRVWSLGS